MVLVRLFWNWPKMCRLPSRWARGASEAIRVGGPAACDTAPITMDGKAVFRFAVETMPRCLQTVLERSQKTLADLDWVVCHQANSPHY